MNDEIEISIFMPRSHFDFLVKVANATGVQISDQIRLLIEMEMKYRIEDVMIPYRYMSEIQSRFAP